MQTPAVPIEEFFKSPVIAVVGVSRREKGFGARVYRRLKQADRKVYAVNPKTLHVFGDLCFTTLKALPQSAGSAVICIPPSGKTSRVVEDAAICGVRWLWFQPGTETTQALQRAKELGIQTICGTCILLHAQPYRFPCQLHRWLAR